MLTQQVKRAFAYATLIALPAEKLIEVSKVHDLANKLTSRNWKKIKSELLAL